jgi:hypothetical protein
VRGSQQPQRAADYHTTLNKTPRTSLSQAMARCGRTSRMPSQITAATGKLRTLACHTDDFATAHTSINTNSKGDVTAFRIAGTGKTQDRLELVFVVHSLTWDSTFTLHELCLPPNSRMRRLLVLAFANHLKTRQNGPGPVEEKQGGHTNSKTAGP